MELLPDQRSSRTTAILLLVVVAFLVYFIAFHGFISDHFTHSEELGDKKDQMVRFHTTAAQRSALEEQLTSIKTSGQDQELFLNGNDFNEAAASLSQRLAQMVRSQSTGDCQIVSRQPIQPRVEERYQRVTVNVRMRCRIDDLLNVLHELESSSPMILVDELNIVRPRARRRVRGNVVNVPEPLDIRFNMSGYLP